MLKQLNKNLSILPLMFLAFSLLATLTLPNLTQAQAKPSSDSSLVGKLLASKKVSKKPKLSLSTSVKTPIPINTSVPLSGKYSPASKKKIVVFEKQGKKWAIVARTTSTKKGVFKTSVLPTTPGVKQYKAKLAKGSLESKIVKVTVVSVEVPPTDPNNEPTQTPTQEPTQTPTQEPTQTPTPTPDPPVEQNFVATTLSVGGNHSCVLDADSSAWCWGYNHYGDIGDGSKGEENEVKNVPTKVVGDHKFKTISVGGSHICAIDLEDSAWCWGLNLYGQVGDGTSGFSDGGEGEVPYSHRAVPTKVSGDHKFKTISAGYYQTCAIDFENKIWCWGTDDGGFVQSSPKENNIPARVAGDQQYKAVSTGGRFACAIDFDDNAWCWGFNHEGQIGIGTNSYYDENLGWVYVDKVLIPNKVLGDHKFETISAGGAHTCALDLDDSVWCWGDNDDGQLGDGTQTYWDENDLRVEEDKNIPTKVTGSHTFKSIRAGSGYSCGIDLDDNSWCWGNNEYGQLGNGVSGEDEYRTTPTKVVGDNKFKMVGLGFWHSCAIDLKNNVFCWGLNSHGQLGDGTQSYWNNGTWVGANKSIPTKIVKIS